MTIPHDKTLDPIQEARIDRAARALREHSMSGRFTVPWGKLPRSQKKKWIVAATLALNAADQEGA